MLLQDAVDALRAADSIQSDSLVWVVIHTNNIARTWTYLERNGAVIGQFGVGADGEGVINAQVPVSLLMALFYEDHVKYMGEYSQSLQMARFKREFVAELGIVNILHGICEKHAHTP